jgi:flavin-binding protein dodecin
MVSSFSVPWERRRNSTLREKNSMERTFKKIEIVGISEKSFADATQNAVAKAAKTLRNLDWFEVVDMRGLIGKGKVKEFQVTVKIGFRLEGQSAS